MDQRATDVEEDLKDILRTRVALAEKIQLLEHRVEETIQGTKSAAMDLIDHVRNSAVSLVESTAQALDPAEQARQRPWILVGGAIAVGVLAGWLERRRQAVYPYYPPRAKGADVMPSHDDEGQREEGVYPFYSRESDNDSGASHRRASMQAVGSEVQQHVSEAWAELTEEFDRERIRIQAAAVEAGKSFVRDAARILVQSLLDSLTRAESPPVRRSASARLPETATEITRVA